MSIALNLTQPVSEIKGAIYIFVLNYLGETVQLARQSPVNDEILLSIINNTTLFFAGFASNIISIFIILTLPPLSKPYKF